MIKTLYASLIILLLHSCTSGNSNYDSEIYYDTAVSDMPDTITRPAPVTTLAASNTDRESIVRFARSLTGTPYKYGSIDPEVGFDCSGFITYVFTHFKVKVPRSSIDFTNVGREVPVTDARPGDLILFTGTDSADTHVGHMGIVSSNSDTLRFLHSTSGKQYGVTETPLNGYYLKRFVKVIDIY